MQSLLRPVYENILLLSLCFFPGGFPIFCVNVRNEAEGLFSQHTAAGEVLDGRGIFAAAGAARDDPYVFAECPAAGARGFQGLPPGAVGAGGDERAV